MTLLLRGKEGERGKGEKKGKGMERDEWIRPWR